MNRRNLVNFLLYQTGWIVALWAAGRGHPTVAWIVPGVLVAAHLALARRRAHEAGTLLAAACCGVIGDGLLCRLDWVRYAAHDAAWVPPVWIVMLWIQFATLFRFTLAWLKGRTALAFVLGLVGGPIAFLAGERFGAASLDHGRLRALIALAAIWATAVPLLNAVAWRRNAPDGDYGFR